MPKIFISHSQKDYKISKKLAQYLKRCQVEIWIDYTQISPGEALADKIGEGIAWCDTLILVWSKSAECSYFVRLEYNNAISQKKRVIPCLVDDAKVPPILAGFLFINFDNFKQGFRTLAWALKLEIKKDKFAVFRNQPKTLSESKVRKLLQKHDFFDYYFNRTGKGFKNQYRAHILEFDKVIFDTVSGLILQQGGSAYYMEYAETREYIKKLNKKKYAGYNDWRLPTLEEAMSLMEPENNKDELYISSIFDKKQPYIWTSDLLKGNTWAWVVNFNYGACYKAPCGADCYVRAIRSVKISENFLL